MNAFGIISKLPFYPHWLVVRNVDRKDDENIMLLYGKVLETGAGNGRKKARALALNAKITHYEATDYDGWDELFALQTKRIKRLGKVTEALYGDAKDMDKLDNICDALALPYKDRSFDCYTSYEVLEHIYDPELFYQEAHRVLKKGGLCLTTAPYMYREHGSITEDFQRLSKGGYYELAKRTGFKVVEITTNSCFGTSFATLTNQYIIRKIIEGTILVKIPLVLISPILFLLTNTIGFIIDSIDKDERFADHYHVVMKKK